MRIAFLVILIITALAAYAGLLERAPADNFTPGAQDEPVLRSDVPWQAPPDIDPDNVRGF